MRREGQARGAGKDSGAQRRRARSMDVARHEKPSEKIEYGYKHRGAGKKRSGRAAGVGGESSFRSKICSNC